MGLTSKHNKWFGQFAIVGMWLLSWGFCIFNSMQPLLCLGVFSLAAVVTWQYIASHNKKSTKRLNELVEKLSIQKVAGFCEDLRLRLDDLHLRSDFLKGVLFRDSYQAETDDLKIVLTSSYILVRSDDAPSSDSPQWTECAQSPVGIVIGQEARFPRMAIYPRGTWNLWLELQLYALLKVPLLTSSTNKLSAMKRFAFGGLRSDSNHSFYRRNCVVTEEPEAVEKFLTNVRIESFQGRRDLITETKENMVLIYFRYEKVSDENLLELFDECLLRYRSMTS